MKKILFLFTLVLTVAHGLQAQKKYALIIAIGDYPDPRKNGWPKISSANDLPLIKDALQSQDFKPENIFTLKDAAATKAGIEKALDQLIEKAGKDDIIVIHISSHGQQIEDDNDDEVDGLDEAIVPYGAVYSGQKQDFAKYAPGYFRDDLFGQKITLLRNKLGGKGDILVIIDACHSGSGTRGATEAKVRGGNSAMVSSDFDTNKKKGKPDTEGVFKDNKGTVLSNDAATYVVISGAQATERNYECFDDNGNEVGSLSYAFSKSIMTLKESNQKVNYNGLFASIENIMRDKAPKQKPALEGDGLDRALFGGNYISQKPYFTVTNWKSTEECVINAGTISGVTVGSVVSFFPLQTTDPAGKTALNKGTVSAAGNFTATIKLDKPDEALSKSAPWIFLTELAYGANKIKLDVCNINGASKKVQDALKGFELVSFNKACDIYLDTCGSTNVWALKYPNTGAIFVKNITLDNDEGIKTLQESLKRYDRYRYLQGLNFEEEGLSAKIELVFLTPNKEIDTAKIRSRTKFGRLELRQHDEVYLKIINSGQKGFYINVVDVQPDGIINPVIPNKRLKDRNNNPSPVTPEDCYVKKYDSLFLKLLPITINPPFGEENFKVFLSADKLDLEGILTSNNDTGSRGPGGALNNMAKIFKDSEVGANGTRGVDPKVDTDQNGTIFNYNFIIVPRE